MISIIIPVGSSTSSIASLCQSLQNQSVSTDYEVLVIANPANSHIEQETKKFGFYYFSSQPIGVNRARNLGWENSKGEILLFLDDDCLPLDPNFLQEHYTLHLNYPDICMLGGGYQLPPKSNVVSRAYHFIQKNWLLNGDLPGYNADLLLGGNLSLKKELLVNNRFDESIIFGGAETELIFRLAAQGMRIRYFPKLILQHQSNSAILAFLRKACMQGRAAARLAKNNFYHLALTKRNPVEIKYTFGELLWISIYAAFFRASYSSELNKDKKKQSGLGYTKQILIMIFTSAFYPIKQRLLVKIWANMGGAIYRRNIR